MCGINGFSWRDRSLIEAMNEVVRYRGPDDRGVYEDGRVTLGHTRLAIIDVSAAGHQPMSNEDDSVWIAYNGEIYNFRELREDLVNAGHVLKSRTDTEVVIHAYEAYGMDCFRMFNGMWALALYDKKRRRLILSRDRFGIKPLYYHVSGGRLIFSSMIAAILKHGVQASPNTRAVMEYLAFDLLQHREYTFVENVCSLLSGHTLVYDLETGTCDVRPYYTPQARPVASVDELRERFIESVKRRTVSDVPIGVCLSGGIDSTAITRVLDSCLDETFNAYSMVAPGSAIDESRYIEEVGRHAKIRSFYVSLTPDQFLQDVSDFVISMEEPVMSLSPYAEYKVFEMAHEHGAKVLLNGQGGDEIFAGYVYYFGYYFLELLTNLKLRALVSEMLAVSRNFRSTFPHAMFVFLLLPAGIRDRIWKNRIVPWLNHALLEEACEGEKDPRWQRWSVRESLRQTLVSTSIPHNLMWADKSSMRWSVECRVPFLDFTLVEAAMSLEAEQLLKNGRTKRAFKEAAHDLLPDMIRDRKDKIGFGVPMDDFFRHEKIAAFAREIVHSASFKQRPYWQWSRIERMLESHLAEKTNAAQTLWKCINIELWLDEFVGKRGGSG